MRTLFRCVAVISMLPAAASSQPFDAPGFADLHNHQFAQLGFGGVEPVWGAAVGPPDDALKDCASKHWAGGTNDNLERWHPARCGAYVGHKTNGWPRFDGWPRWDTYTHQQIYETWLERAYLGGMRLMVMQAVNSEKLCDNYHVTGYHPPDDCSDTFNVERQLRAAKAFELAIDRRFGYTGSDPCDVATANCNAVFHGDRPGWYRIVYSAQQARDTVAAGKLAVVLGVEVAGLFGCRGPTDCTTQHVTTEVERFLGLGVRHFFPIHQRANGFGSPSIFSDGQGCDEVGRVRECSGEGYEFAQVTSVCASPCGHLPPDYFTIRCSRDGLTPLGKHLVTTLMSKKAIIDLDHMGLFSARDTLSLAEARRHPLVSSHADFFEIATDTRSEVNLKVAELQRLVALGGVVAPIFAPGPTQPVANGHLSTPNYSGPRPDVPYNCRGTSQDFLWAYEHAKKYAGSNVALGTDFNGFLFPLPGPRFGADACPGGVRGGGAIGPTAPRVAYPFSPRVPLPSNWQQFQHPCGLNASGRLGMCRFGDRTFDVNEDGVPHVGLLPDYLEDLAVQYFDSYARKYPSGSAEPAARVAEDMKPLLGSAAAYVRMWERIDGPTTPGRDRFEPNEDPPSATASTAVRANDRLTFHDSSDVDVFSVNLPACADLVVRVRYAGSERLAVEVIDAAGKPVAAGVDVPGGVEVTAQRRSGRVFVRVAPEVVYVSNGLYGTVATPGEFHGSYALDFATTPRTDVGPEVCDATDNDCNGKVDDCPAGTDPTCVDTDSDGLKDCVDPDDDADCLADGIDTCPTTSNGNEFCPGAGQQACNRCRMPDLTAAVGVFTRWAEVCLARPLNPACMRAGGCELEHVFGKEGKALFQSMKRQSALLDPSTRGLLGRTTARLSPLPGTKVQVLPLTGASVMSLECAWGPSLERAKDAFDLAERNYQKCLTEKRKFVSDGLCNAPAACRP